MQPEIKNVVVVGSGYLLPIAVRSLLDKSDYRHKYVDLKESSSESLRKIKGLELIIITKMKLSQDDQQFVKEIVQSFESVPVLLVSIDVSQDQMIDLIRSGLKGLITEDAEIPLVGKAVQALHKGELWCPRNLFYIVLQSFQEDGTGNLGPLARKSDISDREQEILNQMAMGKTNKEIASALGISYSTVVNHSNNIYKKLNVNNRTSAIRVAAERNILKM